MSKQAEVNTQEAAKVLGYSYGTLVAWRKQLQRGPQFTVRPNGTVFYLLTDLHAWSELNKTVRGCKNNKEASVTC